MHKQILVGWFLALLYDDVVGAFLDELQIFNEVSEILGSHPATEVHEEEQVSLMKNVNESVQLVGYLGWRLCKYSFKLLDVRVFDDGGHHYWDYALKERIL